MIAPTVAASEPRHSPKPLPAPLARKPGDVATAMICQQVFDSISVHANGDIVCWCVDVEGKRVYGNVHTDRIADVYNGSAYREIRKWMLRSQPDTWCPAIDSDCPLRIVPASTDQDTSNCRIKILKLEPVTYCNLQCPMCPVEAGFKQVEELRQTRAHKLLPLETMLDVVAQLPDLEIIEYFDYGEPFIHKDTIAFLREVRRTRPGVQIVTSTNGTVMTPAQINAIATESLMDRIVFSIDGATAESYRKYRVGGTFSKALGKMKALVDACREAGTWRKYVTGPAGRVQITWQYILFDWNDSDEELALARELARNVDVPLQWIITNGFGASQRFLPGSADAARLMDPPDSFIYGWHVENRLKETGNKINYHREIRADCEISRLPPVGYRAEIVLRAGQSIQTQRSRLGVSSIVAPAGGTILFKIDVENKTNQSWDDTKPQFLRLGVLLKTFLGQTIRELPGMVLPSAVVRPGWHDTLLVPVDLPDQPGEYKLVLDLVQEWVCWFGDRGSQPLICTVRVD